MSKARKLTFALCLLGGGYLAAIVLGGVSDSILPPPPAAATAGSSAGWLVGLTPWRTNEQPVSEAGQLVPESGGRADSQQSSQVLARTQPNHPTWLNASSEGPAAPELATRPEPAEPPKLAESPPLEATPISLSTRPAHNTSPQARITEVRPVNTVASLPAASPWDRWPRWPTQQKGVAEASVPATFQDLGASSSQPRQASYHESEVIRKNTPPRDPGAAPVDILRTHVVIDGDTLVRLADRYLDDANRASEIYRLNRDVLSNPELLPIGVELRIPARERPGDGLASLDATASIAASQAGRTHGMVPVPWLPTPMEEVPRAQLLQPTPVDLAQ